MGLNRSSEVIVKEDIDSSPEGQSQKAPRGQTGPAVSDGGDSQSEAQKQAVEGRIKFADLLAI